MRQAAAGIRPLRPAQDGRITARSHWVFAAPTMIQSVFGGRFASTGVEDAALSSESTVALRASVRRTRSQFGRLHRSAQETWATVRMIVRIAAKAVVRMYQERATRLAAAGERGFRLASPWRVDLGWFIRGAGVFRDAEAEPPGHRNIKPFLRPGGEGGGDRWAGAMAATESGGIPSGPRGPWCSRSCAEDRRALRSDPWQ